MVQGPLRRAIQKYVEDPLAEEILGAKHPPGSVIKIKMNKSRDGLEFDWDLAEKSEEPGKPEEGESKSEEEAKA
jgi:ATP-dependent Clp protease ATP-binding subunit ClpC